DCEPALAVGRIQPDQVSAAVRLHRPPGVELAVVAGRPEERGPEIGRVGHQQTALGPQARTGGEAVTKPQLLYPLAVAPHPSPRSRAPRVGVPRGPDALHAELERAAQRVGAQPHRISAATQRLLSGREERAVHHQAVPAATLNTDVPLVL